MASLSYLALVCHALGDAARSALLYPLLAPYRGRNLMVGTTIASFGAADGVLGMLAATMGDLPRAERLFEDALAMNERPGSRLPSPPSAWRWQSCRRGSACRPG